MKKLLFILLTAASLNGEAQLVRPNFADAPPGPYLVLNPTGLSLNSNFAGSLGTSSSYTMTWNNWTASADTVVAPTGVVISVDNVNFSSSLIISTPGSHSSVAIYAALASGNSPGTYGGNITHTAGAVIAYEGVSGTTNGVPSLSVSPSSLTLTDTVTQVGAPQQLTVTSAYLSGSINVIASSAPTPIQFSQDNGATWASSLSFNGSPQNVLVQVTAAASQGTILDTITVSSSGVSSIKIPVGGTVANPGLAHYRAITIPTTSVTGSLTNFPVVINETQTYLKSTANGGEVQNANGYDITFSTDAAGTSLLKWEVETYNPATGQLVAWVKVPSLSTSSATTIYMRYNQSTITTFQGGSAGSVWDANSVLTAHMNQVLTAAGQTENDYTSNGNNYTSFGTWASGQSVSGPVGLALKSLNANGDYLQWATSGFGGQSADFTFEGWFNITVGSNASFSFGAASYGNTLNWYSQTYRMYNGADAIVDGATTPLNTWTHLVVTRSGNNLTIYRNGTSTATATQSTGFTYNFQNLFYNGTLSGSARYSADISADEVRISNVARSAAWVAAEYLNMNAPDTFYSIGTEH